MCSKLSVEAEEGVQIFRAVKLLYSHVDSVGDYMDFNLGNDKVKSSRVIFMQMICIYISVKRNDIRT